MTHLVQGQDPNLKPIAGPYNAHQDPLPSNPFLTCSKSETDADSQASVAADVATANIKSYCSKVSGTSLDADKSPVTFNTFPVEGNDKTVVALAAALNVGDPECTAERKIDENECNAQLALTLNDCDKEFKTNKHGGVIVSECIAWSVAVTHGDNSAPLDSSDPAPKPADKPSAGKFKPGWCTMHVTQWQKNTDDGAHPHSPEYNIDVEIFDGADPPKPLYLYDCDGCGTKATTVALNGAPNVYNTVLPNRVIVVVGAKDEDVVKFEYGDQKWDSNDQVHHSNFGPFEDQKRQGDTGFSC